MTKNREDELSAELTHFAEACRLDSWSALIDETRVPMDILPALMSGRPELIKLVTPRKLTAEESGVLLSIIASLLGTNMALREHAERLAQFTDQWTDSFKQLYTLGARIKSFAHFQHHDAATPDTE